VPPEHILDPGSHALQASLAVLQPEEQVSDVRPDPSVLQVSRMFPLQPFAPGRQALQAMRVLLQLWSQVCRSRGSPAGVHSRKISPAHQTADGSQARQSFFAESQPEVHAIILVPVPSGLHTTRFAPSQVRALGRHKLHSSRTALHPCAQLVLATEPLGSQTLSTSPTQVLAVVAGSQPPAGCSASIGWLEASRLAGPPPPEPPPPVPPSEPVCPDAPPSPVTTGPSAEFRGAPSSRSVGGKVAPS
jgi:hypothetical protein